MGGVKEFTRAAHYLGTWLAAEGEYTNSNRPTAQLQPLIPPLRIFTLSAACGNPGFHIFLAKNLTKQPRIGHLNPHLLAAKWGMLGLYITLEDVP